MGESILVQQVAGGSSDRSLGVAVGNNGGYSRNMTITFSSSDAAVVVVCASDTSYRLYTQLVTITKGITSKALGAQEWYNSNGARTNFGSGGTITADSQLSQVTIPGVITTSGPYVYGVCYVVYLPSQ